MRIIRRILTGLVLLVLVLYVGLVVYAYWPTGIEEVPARQLAGPADRFVVVNGLELRYRTYGEPRPERPNLVLIHGFGNSLQSFRLLAPLLVDDYYVITMDLPGFGLSAKPVDHDYHNPAQARLVGDFSRALGLDEVIVGGHSLGGAIALRVAINEREVIGLVLMNPGIITTGVPWIAEYYFFPLPRLSARQFGNREFRERLLKRSFINPEIVTDEVMDDLMLAVRSDGYLTGTTSLMGQYTAATEAELLADVELPTLIVWGKEDRNKSRGELEQLRQGLRDSMVVEVTGAGHYVHEENPTQVAQGLIDAKPMWRRAVVSSAHRP